MKATYVLLVLTSLLAFSSSIQVNVQDIKDFTTGFFQVVNGTSWKWNDECLNNSTLQKIGEIVQAIKAKDYMKVIMLGQEVYFDQKDACPLSQIAKVYIDADDEIRSGKIVQNAIAQMNNIIQFINKEQSNPPKTAAKDGTAVGDLVNMIVYNKAEISTSLSLRFLAQEATDDDVNLFITGFLEGLSDVPLSQSKCYKSLGQFQQQMVKAFKTLINAIKTRSNFKEAIKEMIALGKVLLSSDASCHMAELFADIESYSSPIGIAKLTWRVMTHLTTVISDAKTGVNDIEQSQYENSGKAFGNLFSIVNNFKIQ